MKKTGVILSVLLVLVFAVGCGSKDAKDDTENVTTQEVEATTEETEGAEEKKEEVETVEATEAADDSKEAADEAVVESFAEKVKTAIVNSSWSDLGDMISYPITVGGTEVADKDAFVNKMNEATVSSAFVDAVSNADCSELFANGQGISIGNGEVWFLDYAYDAVGLVENGEPDFKIITLNGIVE